MSSHAVLGRGQMSEGQMSGSLSLNIKRIKEANAPIIDTDNCNGQ